eukprot:2195401-Rhodomonas_salina.2
MMMRQQNCLVLPPYPPAPYPLSSYAIPPILLRLSYDIPPILLLLCYATPLSRTVLLLSPHAPTRVVRDPPTLLRAHTPSPLSSYA